LGKDAMLLVVLKQFDPHAHISNANLDNDDGNHVHFDGDLPVLALEIIRKNNTFFGLSATLTECTNFRNSFYMLLRLKKKSQ
jgi:hypothetical protein